MDSSDPASLKGKLLRSLASNWEDVVKLYEQEPLAHKIEITKYRNTALHIAVSSGREDIVEKLVNSIKSKNGNPMEVLSMQNVDGNNPLHLGASLGSISICTRITAGHKQLLAVRNRVGDTPLLRAVRYGKKDLFLSLYGICEGDTAQEYCRNPNGKSALHLAIEGKHMDLALQIIDKQGNLMNSVDPEGRSPLYVLAEKPTAFRSGIHLSLLNKIMYHCISVEELIPETTSKVEKKNLLQELGRMIKFPGKSKKHLDAENPEEQKGIKSQDHNSSNTRTQGHKPGRYLRFIKLLVFRVLLVIISVMPGSSQIKKLKEKKEMHVWSLRLMNRLLEHAEKCAYEMNPKNYEQNRSHYSAGNSEYLYFQTAEDQEPPILVASRNGILEMVEKILELFPMAIYDTHGNNWKNLVLMAVENRQSHIYDFLLNNNRLLDKEIAFHTIDKRRNSALHLAGRLAGYRQFQSIPTSMLQMQWEIKWYQYVKNSLGQDFVVQINREGHTPDEIFQREHQMLEKESKEWINSTSNSCSFIAALIATVAFASSSSVPGGVDQNTGVPLLEHRLAFSTFAMSSLLALCCSMISLLIFLAVFVSKGQDKDFTKNLPRNFLLGLTSLFISIAAMLTCFCSGNFLIIKHQLKYAAAPVYALTSLVMAYFVVKHFPLFLDLLKATFRKVPERIYEEYM